LAPPRRSPARRSADLRATGSARHEALAKSAFAQVWEWSKDLRLVGRPRFEGETPSHGLAIPMILLNLIEEVSGDHWRDYEAEVRSEEHTSELQSRENL